ARPGARNGAKGRRRHLRDLDQPLAHRIGRRQGAEVPDRRDRRPRLLPLQGRGPRSVVRESRQRASAPIQPLVPSRAADHRRTVPRDRPPGPQPQGPVGPRAPRLLRAQEVVVRPARPEDRAAIAAIQRASPEASSWDPAGYEVTVAEVDGRVAGFLVIRQTAPDEVEVLNLAVAPEHRRKGVARDLLQTLLERTPGDVFLEVRESNLGARLFYQSLGFTDVSRRPEYYSDPPDAGIVMN